MNVWVRTAAVTKRILLMDLQTEHRNPEGRTYWFNTGTRESVWEKPDGVVHPNRSPGVFR